MDTECLRIARPKAGLFVVIPMRQAGLPYASGDGPWLGHLERMADRAYAA
jgi:hypothetical protein